MCGEVYDGLEESLEREGSKRCEEDRRGKDSRLIDGFDSVWR